MSARSFKNLFLACALLGASAHAAFPDKPIRLVVPWAAGGSTDAVARAVAQRMGAWLEHAGARAQRQALDLAQVFAAVGLDRHHAARRQAEHAGIDGVRIYRRPVGQRLHQRLRFQVGALGQHGQQRFHLRGELV